MSKQEMKISQIEHFAIHPGGKKILEEFQNALDINAESMSSSIRVLRDFGNMSSSTILFILKDLLEKLERSGSDGVHNVLALAFGPGFTIELTIFRVHV